MKKKRFDLGFTLIELLVVMAILGILSTIGLNSFRVSQAKSRDARRKSDLGQIQRALEMYYNDKGTYPGSLAFGSELNDPSSSGTIYMKEIPQDPSGNPGYCYVSTGNTYKIYAKLENSQDVAIGGPYSCGGCSGCYNYGVSSSNTSP